MRGKWAASALAYAAITCAMGHRVLASLSTAIASDAGDPLLNAAILAWNAQQIPWTDAWFQFPIFHPTADALTLSEHLLGVSFIASPVYWLTDNAVLAYNVALLLAYPLSGMAMYALTWRLTHHSAAAFVAGLAFAFAPYRASQLPHIQMLTVFWAPLALLGLHGFEETRQKRWLAVFALSWAIQGAANGYLLVYLSVLVGMWILWFLIAHRRWRDAGLVAGAAVVAALPLLPILYRYMTAHSRLGLTRNLGEIASFGADIAAPLCAGDRLVFWRWLRVACAQEGELFAGAAVIVLCAAGLWQHQRFRAPSPSRVSKASNGAFRATARRITLAIGVLFLVIAITVVVAGPWQVDLGWIRASASSPDKPTSTALGFLLIAFVLSDRFYTAVARRSIATFYGGAAVICWILSWGPFPRLLGTSVLYQAPYAWLLQLPGVDNLRVPARFWMLTVFCLSVLAGLACARLLRGRTARASAAAVALAASGLLIDGWVSIPVAAIPSPLARAESLRNAPVLVLPVGQLERDVAVVYHAVAGRWRALNGFSGYEPPYYEALRTLSAAGDEALLEPFLRLTDIHVIETTGLTRRLARRRVPPDPVTAPPHRIPARPTDASCSREGMALAADRDLDTYWVCGAQHSPHHIVFELERLTEVATVVHALGSRGADFPRHLVVETSVLGALWEPAWEGSPAAAVLLAAVEAPRDTRAMIRFAPRQARYVRLRQTGRHETNYWSMAEFEVWTGRR